jgi:hypothetical protein
MFPLKQRILIRGAAAHIKAGLGAASDYVADHVLFVIPFDGRVETYWGKEGGNWLRLIRPSGDKIELAHLSKYAVKSGEVKAGQTGGITGNTGAITTGPHLHIQIFNKAGKRLDPETYNWGKGNMNPNIVIYKNGREYHVATKAISKEGFAQLLVETGCYDLLAQDGGPDFAKIDKIAHVL